VALLGGEAVQKLEDLAVRGAPAQVLRADVLDQVGLVEHQAAERGQHG
jgi:hypothetical protein